MNQLERFYDLLGVRPGAPFREVRQAYLRLVRTWHPDRYAGDPQRQRLAQERLKAINEAYRELEAVLAADKGGERKVAAWPPPSPSVRPSPGESARPRVRRAPPAASGTASAEKGVDAGGLVRFLSFWPNVLLLVYLLFTARMATVRGGVLYFLQMAVVPLLFAVLCNSRLGGRQSLWKAYVAAICIFAVLLAADASMMRRGGREAWAPRYPDSGEPSAPAANVPFGGALPDQLPGEPDRRSPGALRQVAPPTPPTAPESPSSPAAPVAPVVPRGR